MRELRSDEGITTQVLPWTLQGQRRRLTKETPGKETA